MSQTFIAALPCHRTAHYPAVCRPTCAGFIGSLAHAQACCNADRLLTPLHA